MKRKVMGTILIMLLLAGSCMTVSAQEAAQQEDAELDVLKEALIKFAMTMEQ